MAYDFGATTRYSRSNRMPGTSYGRAGTTYGGRPVGASGSDLFAGQGPRPGNNAGMGTDPWSLGSSGGLGGVGVTRGGAGAYPGQDAGDRRLANSSVNWGAFGGIQNWLQNAPPGQRDQRAAYLESMGMMPSYNGVPLSQALAGGAPPMASYLGTFTGPGAGRSSGGRPGGSYVEDNPGNMWGAGGQAGGIPRLQAPGGHGGGFSVGGSAGGFGAKAGGLEGGIDAAYSRMIAQGGSPYTSADRTRMEQGSADTANRATSDAVEDARLSAARRGRTLGAEEEARIRMRGAAGADRARFDTRTGLAGQSQAALLAALSGAGASVRDRRQAEILRGQLEAQAAGVGLGGLQFAMGL